MTRLTTRDGRRAAEEKQLRVSFIVSVSIGMPLLLVGVVSSLVASDASTIGVVGTALAAALCGYFVLSIRRKWSLFVMIPLMVVGGAAVSRLGVYGAAWVCPLLGGLYLRFAVISLRGLTWKGDEPEPAVLVWDGTGGINRVEEPAWPEVKKRIEALGRDGHVGVAITGAGGRLEVCYASVPGAYLVFVSVPGSDFGDRVHQVLSSDGGGDRVDVTVGSWSGGPWPVELFVSQEAALTAAAKFVKTGERASSLRWGTEGKNLSILRPPALWALTRRATP